MDRFQNTQQKVRGQTAAAVPELAASAAGPNRLQASLLPLRCKLKARRAVWRDQESATAEQLVGVVDEASQPIYSGSTRC